MRHVFRISGLMWMLIVSTAVGAAEPRSLTGVVSGPDGQPIEGAAVNVYSVSIQMEPSTFDIVHAEQTTSDADGRFSLSVTPLPRSGPQLMMLFAEKDGLSIAFAYVMQADGEIRLELTAPQTLSGRVEDARGVPVADAFVQLPVVLVPFGELTGQMTQFPLAIGLEPVPYFAVRTDAEGRFAVTNLPKNCTAEILVKKTGHAPFQSAKRFGNPLTGCTYTVGQDDIVLTLPDPCTLTGIVTGPDGQPVGQMKVVLRESDSPYPLTYTPVHSDADGAFTFTDVAPGSVTLSVIDPNWVSETVTVHVQADTRVPLKISKGTLLTVTVMDGVTEKPIEGAHVQINLEQRAMPHVGNTQQDGTFQKQLAPGTYNIFIHASGFRSPSPQTVEIGEEDDPIMVTISLGASAKITGTVAGPDSTPLANVEIFILPGHGMQRSVVTDENGKFVLGWEPEQHTWTQGEFYIVATHQDKNLAIAEAFSEDTTDVRLTLQPGLSVSGKVVDPEGKPIADAAVDVMFRGSRWSTSLTQGRRQTTDTDGRYTVSALPPDQRYNVAVRGPSGYGAESMNLDEQAEGRLITVPETTLKHANLSVSGTVVDENGNPIQGVRLNLHGSGQPSGNAVTDTDGKYTFEAVCEGMLRINAWHQVANEYLRANVQTEGGAQDVTLILAPQGRQGGFVPRRPASLVGKPLPELSAYGLEPADEASPTLVCVWDWRQRPSRHLVRQLAERADTLAQRSVRIVLLNAEPTERAPLEAWLADFDIPFACGIIEEDPEKTRFALGVHALPWLILTDTEGAIVAEGFDLSALTAKLDGVQ